MPFTEDPTNNSAVGKNLLEYHATLPFVSELADLLPHGITKQMHRQLVIDSVGYNNPFLATQMTRQIDLSGLVPNVADVCNTPDEVLAILNPLATEQIQLIKQDPLREIIFKTLEGTSTSPMALKWLDTSLGKIINALRSKRGPISLRMQQGAYDALKVSGGTIVYYPTYEDGHTGKVDYVTCAYLCPPLSKESAQILQTLTPALLKRGSYEFSQHYPVTEPIGYLRQIGIVGWPYLRSLIDNIDQIRQTGSYENVKWEDFNQRNP